MTHSEYLANPAYGSSDIIAMSRSFAYYKRMKATPKKPTRPLVIGSVTHLMLEAAVTDRPGLLDGFRVYDGGGSSLTDAFKAFQAANPAFYCVDKKENELCKRMTMALMADAEVMGYLNGAETEQTVMANYPGTTVPVKVRPDYLHRGRGVSINVKTATDSSESGFLYSAKDYGHDWQSAFYCAVLSHELGKPYDEVHIVVEKGDTDEECFINIFSFGDDTLAFARSQIWEIMKNIPECEKSGIWPKNTSYLKQLELPMHMRRTSQI